MAKPRAWLIRSAALAAIASISAVGQGRPVAVSRDVPVADTVANVETWIKAHPNDAAACCVLGRIHALAWAYGDTIPLVGAGKPDALPSFSEASTVFVSRVGPGEMRVHENKIQSVDRAERPVSADDARHLAASIAAYSRALSLDPNDALSELGLAWMLAQQGLYARQLPAGYFADPKATDAEKAAWNRSTVQLAAADPAVRTAASKELLAAMPRCVRALMDAKTDNPEATARIDGILRNYFDLQALDHFRKAFQLRQAADLAGQPTYQADSQVSAKAGTQILAVLARHPDVAWKNEVESVQAVLKPLAEKQRNLMMMPQ